MRTVPAVLVVLVLAALPACEKARFGGGRPNVVLVSVDTLRADALEPYGGPVPTPSFQRLAEEGVLFERAYATAPETAPSQASLLTGLRVLRHGVAANGMTLSGNHLTLAEEFRDHGYATAAFVSSSVLEPRFGWRQGFDTYDADFAADAGEPRGRAARAGGEPTERRAVATTLAATHWLRAAREPFFLFVHYFDPHPPYLPSRSFASRVAGVSFDVSGRHVPGLPPRALLAIARAYHAEVLYLDDALGELLAAVDARADGRDTLLVVTANHGEGLGDHGGLEHGANLYDEQLQVPLIFRWPGRLPAGKRLSTAVSLRVVAPTITELAFLGPLSARDARSVASSLRAGREPEGRPVFAERRPGPAPELTPLGVKSKPREMAVRHGRWKLIRGEDAPPQLYDVESDPEEEENVAARHPEVARELGVLLDELVRRNPPGIAPLPQPRQARPQARAQRGEAERSPERP
jgi:arylsulfatase A-like enzyme